MKSLFIKCLILFALTVACTLFLVQNIQDRFWDGAFIMGVSLSLCVLYWWGLYVEWRERRR